MSSFWRVLMVLNLALVLWGCNNSGTTTTTKPALTRIDISPLQVTSGTSDLTLAAGNKLMFTAVGYYADGSSGELTELAVDNWQSSDNQSGFFDKPGELTAGNKPGAVDVYVIKGDIRSNTVPVTVTSAVITSIAVTPPIVKLAKGQSVQLAATAIYSDNTSHPVTDVVSYHVEDDSVITVSSSGLLFGESEGVTRLTVSKDGIVSNVASVNVTSAVITAIKVMPASVSVPKGTGLQLVATAQYSDGSSSDSPGQFLWASANPMIAEVNELGMVTGKTLGTTTITASSGEISSGQVDTNVTDAVLTNITTSDNTITLAKGQTKQLSATAWYSDGTSSNSAAVVWLSSDPNIATITADSGELRAVAIGDAVITATLDNVVSPDIEVNATAAVITDIAVTPSKFIVKQTAEINLKAEATFSDNTSSEITDSVTWEVNDPNAATITPNGLLTGVNPGNAYLTAKKDGVISNSVNFEILCDTRNDCIDVIDLGDGTLFTNTPSPTAADKYNIIYGNTYFDLDGLYATFTKTEGEAVCLKLKSDVFSGRGNWRVPTIAEMSALYQKYGNMWQARGWPYIAYYQTSSPIEGINMGFGNVHTTPGEYVSCVSEP